MADHGFGLIILKYPALLASFIASASVLSLACAQNEPKLLYSLNQLPGKSYCFEKHPGVGPNDPRQLQLQSQRDSIRVALGTSGMAEAISGECDYLVRYSIVLDQFQDIEMQPINLGPGPYWGAYPYGYGGYPGWGAVGGVGWVPVVVTRQKYQLGLDLFLNQHPTVIVYQGRASALFSGQDPRMMITNLASKIMENFPANNLLLSGQPR